MSTMRVCRLGKIPTPPDSAHPPMIDGPRPCEPSSEAVPLGAAGRAGGTWIDIDRDARRAIEGADDDYDFAFSADDDCPLCGGSGVLDPDDDLPPEPCPDCGGRP